MTHTPSTDTMSNDSIGTIPDLHNAKPEYLRIAMIFFSGIITSTILLLFWMVFSLKFHASWMPVLISVVIAITIKNIGKSDSATTGIFSALCSLTVAFLGNMILIIIAISKYGNNSITELLTQFNPVFVLSLLKVYTRPIDLLMYAGTIFGGYWFAFFHSYNVQSTSD